MEKIRIYDEKRKKWYMARICRICGGHEPVTKNPTDEECVGHLGLREGCEAFLREDG